MPHIHFLAMGVDYIPWQEVRWAWMNTIGQRFVNVDVRAVYDVELTMHYLAKYLGKNDQGTLEDGAYLHKLPPGRCWGIMRSNLVKRSERHKAFFFETDEIASLRHYACPEKVELIDAGMCSFTILGPKAAEIGQLASETELDQGRYFW